jgi:UPF0271 protein
MLINCDLGECLTPNPDADVMPLIDMANIACGGHAGNDVSMVETIKLATKNRVRIGAHPSYADQLNFGRVSHDLNDDELFDLIYDQVSYFQELCTQNGARLEYIKPHGALYHDMTQKQSVLSVICNVIKAIDVNLSLIVQAGNEDYFNDIEKDMNAPFLHEVFADRGYNGTQMIARSKKGAVLTNANTIVEQYQKFLSEKSFKIDTICFHSDNMASVEGLKLLKNV